jgi:hypothetical protein
MALSGLGYVVAVEGLDSLDLTEVPFQIKRFASQAINGTARKFRTESSRRIREQVNFPARYLDSKQDGNLRITQNATADVMEAVIEGRFRPTSLARFVTGARTGGRKSPTVEVSPGNREKMNRAFLMNLRSGNVGLAIRVGEGERIENKTRMVRVSSGLYLLYGPSVDQVFRQVAEDVKDDAAAYLEQEFIRLSEALG